MCVSLPEVKLLWSRNVAHHVNANMSLNICTISVLHQNFPCNQFLIKKINLLGYCHGLVVKNKAHP